MRVRNENKNENENESENESENKNENKNENGNESENGNENGNDSENGNGNESENGNDNDNDVINGLVRPGCKTSGIIVRGARMSCNSCSDTCSHRTDQIDHDSRSCRSSTYRSRARSSTDTSQSRIICRYITIWIIYT